jgi:hypothetical protein
MGRKAQAQQHISRQYWFVWFIIKLSFRGIIGYLERLLSVGLNGE